VSRYANSNRQVRYFDRKSRGLCILGACVNPAQDDNVICEPHVLIEKGLAYALKRKEKRCSIK